MPSTLLLGLVILRYFFLISLSRSFSEKLELIMHIFAASSLYQAIQTLPGGDNKRQSYLTVIPGLHLNKKSAKNF